MTPAIAFRVVSPDGEQWFDDTAAADAAVAIRLGVAPSAIESLRRRITVDPVVVRRDGARWRSRQVWTVRSGEMSVRVFEMLQIDEAVYEH
jgi:hypothetical protein